MNRTPVKLARDPILEAICELRFESAQQGVEAILLSVLMTKFRDITPNFSKLPTAEIPQPLREQDDQLRHAPHFRLAGREFTIAIGSHSVIVAALRPYAGWAKFRPMILEVLRAVLETGQVARVARLSVRYVNLLSVSPGSGMQDVLRVSLSLGEDQATDLNPTMIRRELRNNGIVRIVQVMSPSTAEASDGSRWSGIAVDVDIIRLEIPGDFSRHVEEFIDELHGLEKSTFFGLIREEALQAYEPVYEPN